MVVSGKDNRTGTTAPTGARASRAFSLIELLVVVCVIAVLAAMLLPSMVKMRSHAREMSCMSNQKQLGVAYHSYASNYGGFLPHVDAGGSGTPPDGCDWYTVLNPFLGSKILHSLVKQCSEFIGDITTKHSYKMNEYLDRSDAPFYKLGTGTHESNTVLVLDGRTDSAVAGWIHGSEKMVLGRHRVPPQGPCVGRAAFLLLDGHGKVVQGDFELISSGNAWRWANKGPFCWHPSPEYGQD